MTQLRRRPGGPTRLAAGSGTPTPAVRKRNLGASLMLGVSGAVVCGVLACGKTEPRSVPATPTVAALPTAGAEVEPAPTAAAEALPRAVGAITLRMSRAAVERALGALSCHDNPDGFEVCRATEANRGESTLEIFFVQNEVVSLAREIPAPTDVLGHLESLTKRYGKPSLRGLTKRDRNGRLHEVYGWKDANSLYSVRFIWYEEGSRPRRLGGAAVALWDREAYGAWERKHMRTPPAGTPRVT